jgi:hypothetical protein
MGNGHIGQHGRQARVMGYLLGVLETLYLKSVTTRVVA